MKDISHCGFLNVRKPRGMTSSDVVEVVRQILGVNAGHAGTLDPQAEGVLVLGLGPARKFIRYMQTDKEYETLMRLGQESDTLDMDGHLTPERPVEATPEAIREAGQSLVGNLELPVPVYSAVHVGGQRLYKLARAGEAVTPPVRPMTVYTLTVTEIALPQVRFTVSCAGGVYVRALTAEWGRQLGCGAVCERLVRTRSGGFMLDHAVTLEDLRRRAEMGQLNEVILPIGEALAHLPEASFDNPMALRLQKGQAVPAPAGFAATLGQRARLARPGGEMIGIGRVIAGPVDPLVLQPERMLPS